MQDLRFPTTAAALGRFFNAPVIGDDAACVEGLSALQNASRGDLAFFSNRKFSNVLDRLEGVVLFTSPDLVKKDRPITYIVVDNPKLAFAHVAKQFLPADPVSGVSSLASIHPSVRLGEGVSVGAFAVISEGAVLGAHSIVYPSVYIGPEVEIGEKCEIHPQVTLLTRVRLGDRVKIFSGSVLGSEGFGYLESAGGHIEMPQIGWVVVESDVRIGAKCTIDRSTLGETRIGAGTKVDDQVHIGHNSRVGRNCLLCAQVGLAGSTVLEDDVVLGGQVGLAGQITVGKGARVAAQSGSSTDIKGGETYFGSPLIPIKEAVRLIRCQRQLPQWVKKIKALEEKLDGKS